MPPKLSVAPRTEPRPCANKPCKGCPFTRTSIPGYLGSYSGPGAFYAEHVDAEGAAPCHTSVDYEDPDWLEKFTSGQAGRRCRGHATFFANMLKLPRSPYIQVVEKDRDLVFSWPAEFFAHHGGERLDPLARFRTGGPNHE